MRLAQLATLAETHARARATAKPSTKLQRAIDKKAARLEDDRKLRAWSLAVKNRDHWIDRKTGRRVLKTLSLDPDRAEAHHIVSRDDARVRHDVRNGVTLSLRTHLEATLGRYRIEGTVFFRKGGAKYINATFPVYFVRT